MSSDSGLTVPLATLRPFVDALFEAVGMEADKIDAVAAGLIEADMIGHSTHGLALAPRYLKDLQRGLMAPAGTPEVVSDRGACVTWRGKLLPGLWLAREALRLAADRAAQYGVVTVVIGESQHNGALSTLIRPIAERGLIATINCATPSVSTVAPHGGTRGVLTPNPIAFGYPTSGDPVLIDISSTITTNNMSRSMAEAGEVFEQDWLLTPDGHPTNDPSVVPDGGSLMLLGGMEKGHKGYGMALMVEALSQGLSGQGRTLAPSGINMSVFIQVIDPEAFGGRETFTTEMDHLSEACRTNPPRPGVDQVRLPGDSAARKRRAAMTDGVPLSATIVEGVRKAASDLGVAVPF